MASSRQRLINASSFLSDQKEKIGGLNVKRSTLTADAFKKGTSQDSLGKVGGKESSVGKLSRILRDTRGKTLVNEKKITLLKKVGNLRKDNQKEKVNSPLLESLQAIAATTDSIRDSLIQQQDNDKSTAEQMRREKEEKERKDQEKGLEAPKPLQKMADKVIAPVMSLWDKILKFITTIFLGKILMNFLDWFGNPENQGKIQTLVRFVKDWWPALVGAVVLFGTGFGGLVTGLTVAIATFIPKMLAAITALKASKLAGLGGKGGLLKGALLVGGGVLAGMGIGKMMDKGEGEDVSNEKVQGLNKGGTVRGSGNKDTVPAMLTPGEFVMSKGAVEQYGVDTLESMNAAAGGTNVPVLMPKKKRMGYNEGGKAGGERGVVSGEDKKQQEAYMLKYVNEERALQGLPPLKKITYAEGVKLTKAMGPGPRTSENTSTSINFETMMKTVTKTVNGKTTSESYKMGNDEIKAEAADAGIPTMEMEDGSVIFAAGKFASKKVSDYLASVRERLKDNPEALAKFNAREDVASVTQGLADGSTEKMVDDAYQKHLGYAGGGIIQGFWGGGRVKTQEEVQAYFDSQPNAQIQALIREKNAIERDPDGKIRGDDRKKYNQLIKQIAEKKAEYKKMLMKKNKISTTSTQTQEKKKGGGLFGGIKRVVGGTADQLTGNLFDFDKRSGGGLIRKTSGAVGGLFGGGKKEGGVKKSGGDSGILGPISSNVDAMVNTDKYEVKPKEKKNVVIDYNQEVSDAQQQETPPAGGNDIPAFDVRPPFMTDQDKMVVLGMRV